MIHDVAPELEGRVGLIKMDKYPVQRQNLGANVAPAQAHVVHVVRALQLIHVVIVIPTTHAAILASTVTVVTPTTRRRIQAWITIIIIIFFLIQGRFKIIGVVLLVVEHAGGTGSLRVRCYVLFLVSTSDLPRCITGPAS